MKALLKIVNLYFWKSIIGPFFAFAFPVIFIAILGMMLGYNSMFGGLLIISSMAVSLTTMPQAIFEFKRSSLLKRIGVTPTKPWMFIVISSLYYMVVMIIGTFFSIIIGIALFSSNMDKGKEILAQYGQESKPLLSFTLNQLLQNINWGGFIWSLVLNIMIGLLVGMLLVSVSKSTIMIQGIGLPILILSQFLCAQVLPPNMVKDIDAIWYLGYISPFKSTTIMMIESWNPSVIGTQLVGDHYEQIISGNFNIFDVNADYKIMMEDGKIKSLLSEAERYINLVFPFLWIGLFSGLSLKLFKWSTRG